LAIQQLVRLSGADIFGRPISISTSIYFINFSLLMIGLFGLISIFKDALHEEKLQGFLQPKSYVWILFAGTFFITFTAYIFAGQVTTLSGNGTYIDAHQERYITLLPLLLIAGVVYIMRKYYNSPIYIWVLVVILAFTTFVSRSSIGADHRQYTEGAHQKQVTLQNITKRLAANNVTLALSGDGYGAPLRFWSKDASLRYVSIKNCNQWFPYNTARSWQHTGSSPITTALIVDRDGLDQAYWHGCTDERLFEIYGQPIKKEYVSTVFNKKEPIQLWIFDKDIRSKIIP
jgi:hypothetical protein